MKRYSTAQIQKHFPYEEEFEVTRYNLVIGKYVPRVLQIVRDCLCKHGFPPHLCKKGCG